MIYPLMSWRSVFEAPQLDRVFSTSRQEGVHAGCSTLRLDWQAVAGPKFTRVHKGQLAALPPLLQDPPEKNRKIEEKSRIRKEKMEKGIAQG